MKKTFAFFTLALFGAAPIFAQTVLVNAFKPSEEQQYRSTASGPRTGSMADLDYVEAKLNICGYNCVDGFCLSAPSSGLVGSDKPGFAIFDIDGAYSKLSFVMGPQNANASGDGNYGLVTVAGDGKRLLDMPVFDHDALRYITLDVKGVQQIKFSVLKGGQDIGFGSVKLWKEGQAVTVASNPLDKLPKGKIRLVEQLDPIFCRYNGWVYAVRPEKQDWQKDIDGISINRKKFTSGLMFHLSEGFSDEKGWSYFWLGKRYDKVSFIVGPRDNQSSNASAWLTVKADRKTVWEGMVTQEDLAQQVVVDVAGAEEVSFHASRRSSDLLGQINYGVVDICAYPAGSPDVPQAGTLNVNKDKISRLPDVCPLMSNIRPFSVRSAADADETLFYGESRYITFSMGGEQYYEGLVLASGANLLSDGIDAYAEFDLAGEFDWISFDAGYLSKFHVFEDDILRVFADDKLVLEKTIYCTWPNQYFEIPVYKCRTLRFAKYGNGKATTKQGKMGIGDITLYRGEPVKNDVFEHEHPECPYEADLIDLCGKPYFHYAGRFCSSLTNFSMDECFRDGSTITKYFQMKDGRQINKGFMLETNIPLALEDVTVLDALFMFVTGVGANLSSSNAAAYTGVTGGANPMFSPITLLLEDSGNKQSSAAAFNPYGEYQSCTFTVENRTEYKGTPVKLNVFADQTLVGEYWLDNKMEPLTATVPIFGCHQLMFWLECGDERSGQYVFHDIRLSKASCDVPIPGEYHSSVPNGRSVSSADSGESVEFPDDKRKKSRKEKQTVRVEWTLADYYSCGSSEVSNYLRDVTAMWKKTKSYVSAAFKDPVISQVWVQASDGSIYKCVTFSQSGTPRLSISSMKKQLQARISEGKSLQADIALAQAGVASAALGLTSITDVSRMIEAGKYVKSAPKALSQCSDDVKEAIQATQTQIDMLENCQSKAIDVDGKRSSDTVLIFRPETGETAPATMQRLEYFNF